ncbi:Retrovirus-related Pol polyprotein from transposon 17.6, partial [Mucuna pruriens]
MLDLGASINVMPMSIYKALNFGDLEPTRMTIQLANKSVVQLLGILEDVLVQVNELIFPADFYVLDMEDETCRQGSTFILGRSFFMIARTKIDVHVETLSMEFAMKHPTEDHSLFGIDLIDELVEEYLRLDSSSEDIENLARSTELINYLGSITEEADYEEVHNLPNSKDDNNDIVDLDFEAELLEVLDQVCNLKNSECANNAEVKLKAEIMTAHLVPSSSQVGQPDPKSLNDNSSSLPPPMEVKPLPNHLKYAYLDTEQQLPVIIANNLHQEQEDKLLNVLRQHKKAIGWKLFDLPRINPSIYMHRILMEEEAKPIRQQQRRMNLTILDVVKKEVTKLLAIGIIYPISNSQWVILVQVVPKKFGMTVMKNQHDELVPMWIQNSWRVCIDYRRLNQATHKDHFPLPFTDQVLEKLSRKSHYCFLDGFSSYMQIHIAPEDQHKTTFTYPFGTFAYTRMPFGLCNVPSTFQCCMTIIFLDLLKDCMEVFMDDFTVYANSFDACLKNLSKVLKRCIDTNLVLNFEKCHFMVTEGIMLRHLVSNRGIEVDKSKIDIIIALPNPTSVQEDFTGDSLRTSARLHCPCPNYYKSILSRAEKLTHIPILQAPDWELPFELMCNASNSALEVVLD